MQHSAQATHQDESLEERKQKEIEWSDFRRTLTPEKDGEDFDKYTANLKYYCIIDKQMAFVKQWIEANTVGKDVLEMACGDNELIRHAAPKAKTAIAGDIAPVTIELAKNNAKGKPELEKIDYRVLDCEHTGFPDNSFDVVIEMGALHHMDLDAAYGEAARLLRPDGKFMCLEAIRHNPIIHLYRKLTPHLRTAWEVDHILGRSQIVKGLEYFHNIELKHYFFVSILAVPFRNMPFFKPLLAICEAADAVITRVPGLRWLSWQCWFVLSNPKKK